MSISSSIWMVQDRHHPHHHLYHSWHCTIEKWPKATASLLFWGRRGLWPTFPSHFGRPFFPDSLRLHFTTSRTELWTASDVAIWYAAWCCNRMASCSGVIQSVEVMMTRVSENNITWSGNQHHVILPGPHNIRDLYQHDYLRSSVVKSSSLHHTILFKWLWSHCSVA